MVFSKIICELRTDKTFNERKDIRHHNDNFIIQKSCLENAGFGIVSQFPLDPLHLIDLGVAKKMTLIQI